MHSTLFHLGTVTIYSFGLLLALGIIWGCLTVALLTKQARLSLRGLFDNLLFVIFGGVFGARVAYVIIYYHYFTAPQGSFWSIFALWQGGLIFYGALVGGIVAAWLAFRAEGRALWRWLDLMMLGLLLGVVFGQAGCLLGGCAVGAASASRFTLDHRLPIALYESGYTAALFALSLFVYLKRPDARKGGYIFAYAGFLYAIGRLSLDYWREPLVKWHGHPAALYADLVLMAAFALAIGSLKSKKSARSAGDS